MKKSKVVRVLENRLKYIKSRMEIVKDNPEAYAWHEGRAMELWCMLEEVKEGKYA